LLGIFDWKFPEIEKRLSHWSCCQYKRWHKQREETLRWHSSSWLGKNWFRNIDTLRNQSWKSTCQFYHSCFWKQEQLLFPIQVILQIWDKSEKFVRVYFKQVEHYYNLTLKSIHGLNLLSTFYSNQTKFFVKADQDSFLNLPKLSRVLANESSDIPETFILGSFHGGGPVVRPNEGSVVVWDVWQKLYLIKKKELT